MGVDELIEHWTVLPDEHELVAGKRGDPGACANLGHRAGRQTSSLSGLLGSQRDVRRAR